MRLALTKKRDLSPFRKIALGTWRTAKDPSVYGSLHLRMDEALRYVEAFRATTGLHLTVTHLVGRAVAAALADLPDANAMLRFGRIYLRRDVDLFFQVALRDEQTGQVDLSGVTLRRADQQSLVAIVRQFERAAERVRAGTDEEKEGTRRTMQRLPTWLVGPVLELVSTLIYGLNLDLRWLGLPRDPFGSAMITNIGTLGLEEAYVPLVPYSRVPLLLAMGAVKKVPLVDDEDRVVVGAVMKVHATFDHRILDGVHAAHMAATLKAWLEDPFAHFDPIEQAREEAARSTDAGAAASE